MSRGSTNYLLHEHKSLPMTFYTTCTHHPQEHIKITHDFYHILFIVKGNGCVIYNGKKYTLKTGSGFFVQPGVPIEYYGKSNFTSAYITAYGSAFPGLMKYLGCENFIYFESVNTERFISKIERIVNEFETYRRGEVLSSMTFSFFVDFLNQNNKNFINSSDRIAQYIEQNYSQKLTLEKLAKTEHISLSKLCHDFKNKYKCSIFEYVVRVRLSNAENEISSFPNKPIKDIASSCGFNDASYFCRAFKKRYGKTPLEYKRNF